MKEILDYYLRLSQNNNKPWFDAHKAEYLHVKEKFEALAEKFIFGVAQFDPRCRNLQVKDCVYRIYRDIRFSTDKRPYKDWHGIYVCPRGKNSGMAGYYLHFEPAADRYLLGAGLYCPTKEVLKSVREQIMLEPDEFHRAVQACGEGFHLDWSTALKRFPVGYNPEDKHSEYYRLKTFDVFMDLTEQDVLQPDYLPRALEQLQKCHPFNELLNRCVEYAQEGNAR